MGVFDALKLQWAGQVYPVPADAVMGLIARIEDVVTLGELQVYSNRGTAPLAKMASAYGAGLRYAGCQVEDDEIYAAMLDRSQPGNSVEVIDRISTLLQIMIPPSLRRAPPAQAAVTDEAPAVGNSVSASSKRSTRQR